MTRSCDDTELRESSLNSGRLVPLQLASPVGNKDRIEKLSRKFGSVTSLGPRGGGLGAART